MIRAYIVDDEKRAIELLHETLNLVTNDVEVIGSAKNAQEAKDALISLDIDLLFLDISLGKYTGFDVLLSLGESRSFEVIIVSAHQDKTLKAMRSGVFDYLYKPLDPDELVRALDRYRNQSIKDQQIDQKEDTLGKIAISGVSDVQFLEIDQIICVKAEGNYCNILMHLGDNHVISKNLKHVEDGIASNRFLRVHRSHLINLDYVVGIEKSDGGFVLLKGNVKVPIGETMRKDVLEKLKSVVRHL